MAFELVVLRPGVIYGPGGSAFSTRVGLNLFGLFLHLGGEQPAAAVLRRQLRRGDRRRGAVADAAAGQVYNVHDDDLPTCKQYLAAYKREVKPIRSVAVPYPALALLSVAVERYHAWSKGQFPAIFTPYKSATAWGGNRFDNSKLKTLGWRPIVSTEEGLRRTFEAFREAGRR